MTEERDPPSNRGWFRKGRSGNPGGRPRKTHTATRSAFDVVVDRTLTLSRNGTPREITIEEALQLRTYQEALAGKRMATREVLRWILNREQWFARNQPVQTVKTTFAGTIQDPDNADAALLLLGIAKYDPKREGYGRERAQLLLEPWAVTAALRRRPVAASLTSKEINEIRRCTRDDGTLKLPEGVNQ